MQSYLTLEDIAHTSTRVESLHDELKNTQGKRLIKSKIRIYAYKEIFIQR